MSDLNRVILIGRLVKDIELKNTQSGTSVAGFSIAVNYTWLKDGEKKEQVSFFNCTVWGKKAEAMAKYVLKGHRVGIDGRLSQRSWDDSEGKKHYAIEIQVENFYFLQPKSDQGSAVQGGAGGSAPGPEGVPAESPFDDETIPF